jgi:hypothetical protein
LYVIVTDTVCDFCGKSVLRAPRGLEVEVREGEKLFHLDCYRLYKRHAPPP